MFHASIELSVSVSVKRVVLDCAKLIVVGRLVALRALALAFRAFTSFVRQSSVSRRSVSLHTTASGVDGVVRADQNFSKECVGHVALCLIDNVSNGLINSACCSLVQANCKLCTTSPVCQVLNLRADSFTSLNLLHSKSSFHQIEGDFFLAEIPVFLIDIWVVASNRGIICIVLAGQACATSVDNKDVVAFKEKPDWEVGTRLGEPGQVVREDATVEDQWSVGALDVYAVKFYGTSIR